MANLSRSFRWEKYTPDIGDNLEQPDGARLELEVASGLSAERVAEYRAAMQGVASGPGFVESLLAALTPYVRLVGTHTIEGKPVTNLAEFVAVVGGMSGVYNVRELVNLVGDYNSAEGTSELFSKRHSGGLRITSAMSAATATAGR